MGITKKFKEIKADYNHLADEIRMSLIDMVKTSKYGEIALSKAVKMPILSNQLKLRKTKDGIKEIPFQTIEMANINSLALCLSEDDTYDLDEILFCDEYGHEYGEEDIYGGILTAFTVLNLMGEISTDN